MECGYGCSQVRDEIMVKALGCAWCVCLVLWCAGDVCPLTVSYCGLLYTTRRWLGCLVDHPNHLGSWIGFTFQDRQTVRNGKRVAALLREVETTCRSRVCRQPVRWAPKRRPHQTTAANYLH